MQRNCLFNSEAENVQEVCNDVDCIPCALCEFIIILNNSIENHTGCSTG